MPHRLPGLQGASLRVARGFYVDGVRGTAIKQKAPVLIKKAKGEVHVKAEEVFINTASRFKMY